MLLLNCWIRRLLQLWWPTTQAWKPGAGHRIVSFTTAASASSVTPERNFLTKDPETCTDQWLLRAALTSDRSSSAASRQSSRQRHLEHTHQNVVQCWNVNSTGWNPVGISWNQLVQPVTPTGPTGTHTFRCCASKQLAPPPHTPLARQTLLNHAWRPSHANSYVAKCNCLLTTTQ